jgi:broad-specificity NMP kinase
VHQIADKKLIISITGTPATGKSTFAKKLSDELKDSKIVELNDVVEQYKLFSSIDKMGSKIVKLEELEKKVKEIIDENIGKHDLIVVGHLVPEIKIDQDMIIVLRCSLSVLIKRQEERKYQEEKIKENIISESVDYCGVNSREQCAKTYEIETDDQKATMIGYIKDLKSGKSRQEPDKEEISKFKEMLDLITDGKNSYGF